jgi:hypothetical protein
VIGERHCGRGGRGAREHGRVRADGGSR